MQVTVVVPIGNVLPEGGLQLIVAGGCGGTGSHPPIVKALKVTTRPVGLVAVVVISAGQLTPKPGSGGLSDICPGNVRDGNQVRPPSRLSSVNTSKKLPIRYVPSGSVSTLVRPSEALLGLSRTIAPPGKPLRVSAS